MSDDPAVDMVAEALAMATEDQLIDELKRRNDGVVVALTRPAREANLEEYGIWWKGSTTLAMGLVARAQIRLAQRATQGSRSDEQRCDGDER